MIRYRCPRCGTGRWHAKGCAEVPEEFRDRFGYDEANRDPMIGHETVDAMNAARRLCGQPLLTSEEQRRMTAPARTSGRGAR